MIDNIWSYIVQIVAVGGGGAVISYFMFQQFGKAWLESKFSQRLDELRHEQNKEVARLRLEIDSMLNGTLRLQEKEFEILPRVWELLDESFLKLIFVTSPFQTFADIDKMGDQEVEELLALSKLTESQKASIKVSYPLKRDIYIGFITFERVNDAHFAATELGNYLSRNGILIPGELKDKFTEISTSLSRIAHSVRSTIIYKLPGHIYDYFPEVQSLRPQLTEIETIIHKRLMSHAQPPIH